MVGPASRRISHHEDVRMSTKTRKNPIALNLPRIVALLIIFARRVILAMTNNPWFPASIILPALATVSADVDALEASEAVAQGKGKGTAAARNLKQKTVEDDLVALAGVVRGVANQNPAQAAAIIESAAMALKKIAQRQAAFFEAILGLNSGTVILRVKSAGTRAAYEWQWSVDGKNWVSLPVTTGAKTTVEGLTAGTTYQFRFRTTVKKVTSDWSQPLSFTVH